jgi:hypothetical protein
VPWIPGEYRGPRQAVLPDWKDEERVIDYVSQAISDLLCGPDPGKSKHEYGVNLSDKHRSGITWDMVEAAEGGLHCMDRGVRKQPSTEW